MRVENLSSILPLSTSISHGILAFPLLQRIGIFWRISLLRRMRCHDWSLLVYKSAASNPPALAGGPLPAASPRDGAGQS